MKIFIICSKLIFAQIVLGMFCCSIAFAHAIILDPGHSHDKPGAKSCSGIYEYAYNSNLVSTIISYLAARGIKVDVTRTPDGTLSLMSRAKMSVGKKLLISLHHDSAQQQFITHRNGNPCSEKAQGYSIFVSYKNSLFQESLACARKLGEALRRSGLYPSTHHGEKITGENREALDENLGIYRFDDLVVLKNAKSPALLLEAAVIIHPLDDERAKTKAYQLIIANAVEETIMFIKNSF